MGGTLKGMRASRKRVRQRAIIALARHQAYVEAGLTTKLTVSNRR